MGRVWEYSTGWTGGCNVRHPDTRPSRSNPAGTQPRSVCVPSLFLTPPVYESRFPVLPMQYPLLLFSKTCSISVDSHPVSHTCRIRTISVTSRVLYLRLSRTIASYPRLPPLSCLRLPLHVWSTLSRLNPNLTHQPNSRPSQLQTTQSVVITDRCVS